MSAFFLKSLSIYNNFLSWFPQLTHVHHDFYGSESSDRYRLIIYRMPTGLHY